MVQERGFYVTIPSRSRVPYVHSVSALVPPFSSIFLSILGMGPRDVHLCERFSTGIHSRETDCDALVILCHAVNVLRV